MSKTNKEVVVYDFSTGEYFVTVPGNVLSAAIYEKTQLIQRQIEDYVAMLNREISSKESAVDLLIMSFSRSTVNPRAEYLLHIAEKVSALTKELKELNQFHKTIVTENFYKFHIEQLEKFGL